DKPPATVPTAAASTRPTRYAVRRVRVTNGEIGPGYEALVAQIKKSVQELAPKVLGIAVEDEQDWIGIAPVISADGTELHVALDLPPDARAAARELADRIVSELQNFVRADFERQLAERLEP